MFSQSHAFAFQCPLICNCFCAFWIVLVTIRIAFRNTNTNTRFFLVSFDEETDSEIAVSVKLWLCSVHSLFCLCDFLVHRGFFLKWTCAFVYRTLAHHANVQTHLIALLL